MIPVVDVFAGPGGLGEGFSAFTDSRGRSPFHLVTSIEKDPKAHATLRLRAFARQFGGRLPAAYWQHVRGEIDWRNLASIHSAEGTAAEAEARLLELSPETAPLVRRIVRDAIGQMDVPWILVGGPPCQAYSLVGRSRNKGNAEYSPESDVRQTLYVEYLQLLADHAPPVFVMENVKGLLSAELESQRLFERILDDLQDPSTALLREDRATGRRRPKYQVLALASRAGLEEHHPGRFVVRSEEHGVPQRRHRVILLGVRTDMPMSRFHPLRRDVEEISVYSALLGLPRVRSGLSDTADSDENWRGTLRSFRAASWMKAVPAEVRRRMLDVLSGLSVPRHSRGKNVIEGDGSPVLNHSTRGHMRMDLARYLFASVYSRETRVSPRLAEFPVPLLPAHDNVGRALGHGLFSDRFRVQVGTKPATTVTSHISKDGHYYIHPDPSQCRSLTVREAARLQTFPDDYFFCGPRTAQYHQVGNAVPPRLAERIAQVVFDLLA